MFIRPRLYVASANLSTRPSFQKQIEQSHTDSKGISEVTGSLKSTRPLLPDAETETDGGQL